MNKSVPLKSCQTRFTDTEIILPYNSDMKLYVIFILKLCLLLLILLVVVVAAATAVAVTAVLGGEGHTYYSMREELREQFSGVSFLLHYEMQGCKPSLRVWKRNGFIPMSHLVSTVIVFIVTPSIHVRQENDSRDSGFGING